MTTPSPFQFDFHKDSLGHLLADRRLAVPIYQRSFAWTLDEVDEYFEDIIPLVPDVNREYFMGSIVLSAEGTPGAFSIIDGQQRLVTTSLLIAAIRDVFQERGKKKLADSWHSEYIANFDPDTETESPRLRLNADDNPFYRELVVERGCPSPTRESHNLLQDAFGWLKDRVTELATDAESKWDAVLKEWVRFLGHRLRIIAVDVPTEADAFLIFETLNDRGADLTIADMLKNYLFGRAGNDIDTVRNAWLSALGALDITAENQLFTTFLRHTWNSLHGATRERDLYAQIKKVVTNPPSAVKFAQDLHASATLYAALLNGRHAYWAPFGPSARGNAETLLRLGLEQFRPLQIAAMQNFTKAEVRRTLQALVAWGVRGIIVGGIGGGKTESAYSDAAVAIRSRKIKTAAELLEQLADVVPSDAAFRSNFGSKRITQNVIPRYLLLSLERAESNEREPELVPNDNAEEVTLEHVLPRNDPDQDWPQFDDDSRKLFSYRLGNMCLLPSTPNGAIGSKPWAVKRPILSGSQYYFTSTASSETEWTATVIEKRQKEMAKKAVEVWPRDPK